MSIIQYFSAKVAYSYWRDQPMRAQMICFMLLGNEEIREFNEYLFNDTFLAMYILICIYLVAVNRPFLAALFLTMSCSIKAGAMLMLPSFLGWVQFHYGAQRLIICIVIIIGFQFILLAPISFDPVGLALGFKIGGLSNWYEYLKLAKFLGGDKDRLSGSTYGNTIYWQIVGEKIYY